MRYRAEIVTVTGRVYHGTGASELEAVQNAVGHFASLTLEADGLLDHAGGEAGRLTFAPEPEAFRPRPEHGFPPGAGVPAYRPGSDD